MNFDTRKLEGQIGETLDIKDNEGNSIAFIREMKSFNKTVDTIITKTDKKEINISDEELNILKDIEVLEKVFNKKDELLKGGLHRLQLNESLKIRLSDILDLIVPKLLISGTMHSYSPLKFFEMIDDKIIELKNTIEY